MFANDSVAKSYEASTGWCTIEIQSFGHDIHDYLKKEIVQYCTFEGVGYDDALEYKIKSKADFFISSVDGTNMIEASPPSEFLLEILEPIFLKVLEKELQEESEKQNVVQEDRDAFGRQGVTNGSPDANRYSTGGGLGDGISFGGLGSRSGNLPKPDKSGCDVTQKIEVKVEIQVDRDGRVVAAVFQSATYQNKCIWNMVVDAAKKSIFSVDQSANYRQNGWIKYIIVP